MLNRWNFLKPGFYEGIKLGWVIREETGKRVNYYGDVYYTLTEPVAPFTHPDVRRLTLDDIPIIEASIGVRRMGVSDWKTVLSEGFAAGAVVSDEIVATAVTGPLPERYSDIGVDTAELWRRRGFATAAAAIVARLIQESGRVPVWSCGEDNMPSQRVAESSGFERCLGGPMWSLTYNGEVSGGQHKPQ